MFLLFFLENLACQETSGLIMIAEQMFCGETKKY